MKRISAALVITIVFLSCNGNSKKRYEKTKEELEKEESDHPLNFLSVYGSDKRNFIGQTIVNGIIRNKASVCSYKNVRVKMLFYKSGVLEENHEEVVDEVVRPGSETGFKSRYFTPKGTDSIAFTVMSAKRYKE